MSDFLGRISHFSAKRLALLADELNDRVLSLEDARHAPIAIVGIGCRFPGRQCLNEPLRLTPAARPSERRILRMPVFRRGWRTRGLRLGADKLGQGVAHLPGKGFHLGAGFRLLPILECGNRLGDVLLHFLPESSRAWL